MLHREFWAGIFVRFVCSIAFFSLAASAQQAESPAKPTVPGVEVDVISTMPLPGVDLPLTEIAAPVQALHTKDLALGLDLSDSLNLRLTNVHINEIQGNPFQADVNYRGYTASPLLGTPQGLSVYMDGVRLNQPFGDV